MRKVLCYLVLTALCVILIWRLAEGGNGDAEARFPVPNVILMDEDGEDAAEKSGGAAPEFGDIALDALYSPCAALVDVESGQILAEKNGDEKMYPASMTKLMAALVAVEHTQDWSGTIEIPQEIFAALYAAHASLAGFEPGEKVTPEDLLYGMLLPSGAECCTVYAAWLAGDEETFVEWMNEKAAELGMEHTHFCNTTGLHDDGHYSTAEDMAVLMRECLKNETLRRALMTKEYRTGALAGQPDGLVMESTLFQVIDGSEDLAGMLEKAERAGAALLGGKTGYTSQAGLCLASFGRAGGREYVLVTAGAEGNHNTEPFHVEDALAVYAQLGGKSETGQEK